MNQSFIQIAFSQFRLKTMPRIILIITVFLFSFFTTAKCQSRPGIEKPHHISGGFKNPNPDFQKKGLSNLFRWQWERRNLEHSLDPNTYPIFPVQINDGVQLKGNTKDLSVTWVGHATTLIQMDGLNVLTDPNWSERCSPISFIGPKRYTPPGIELNNLPKIDAILLSHNHYDHTDLPTLKELSKKFNPKVFVGLGNKKLLEDNGITNVIEMDWWDEIKFEGVGFNFTPTQHFSGRGLFDRDETLWGSFVLVGKSQKVYFAGDTGYYSHFLEIGSKWKEIDVAILPIGAFEPRWFMAPVHVDPEEAAQSFADLGAKYLVPMHYMTFVLSDEKLDSPVPRTYEALKQLGKPRESFIPLKIGETRFF